MKNNFISDQNSGFTLLELTIVVAIISILATIAIPKLAQAIQRSKEGSTIANLGALRSAITFFYADTEGQFPADLTQLTTNSKYINKIPTAKAVNIHSDSLNVTLSTATSDSGGWAYNNVMGDPNYGTLSVNCTHVDIKGNIWSNY